MNGYLSKPLGQTPYLVIGLSLGVFKYVVEAGLVYFVGGAFYSPLAFILPLASLKAEAFRSMPESFVGFAILWTLPYLFIALTLTVRRCIDADLTPWMALWMLCPLFNLVFIVVFVVAPTVKPIPAHEEIESSRVDEIRQRSRGIEAVLAILFGLLPSAAALILGVYFFRNYGQYLFIITPIVMTSLCSFRFASRCSSSLAEAVALSMICLTTAVGLMLLFALEGVICIAMAVPLIYSVGFMGALLGYAFAQSTSVHRTNWSAAVVMLPSAMLIEHFVAQPQIVEVVSTIEIAAPPSRVWPAVIEFSPITEPPSGIFRFGVAYPKSARIDGSGVGAIRYCEFSTGAFVEPITAWQPPNRLAFDVASQPDPMTELSPYNHVHPPHLDGFLSSHRGEFRLTELAGNRTRLEGHTWYSVDMYPDLYWQFWSDRIIHAIHLRVLEHIRDDVQRMDNR